MRRFRAGFARALVAALVASASSLAFAQQSPFDMSPERPLDEPPAVAPVEQPTPPTPAAPSASSAPAVQPSGMPQAAAPGFRRHVTPAAPLRFQGEVARRSWAIYLTAAQAASAASFSFGYQNAIVVAPENSRLRIAINGTEIAAEPIQSAEQTTRRTLPVSPGLLREGRNEIAMTVVQRHRTDCTIQSTYELWTEVSSRDTFLDFADPNAARYGRLEDLKAIGADENGRATIRIVSPALQRTDIGTDIVRLSEALALRTNIPDLVFDVRSTMPATGEEAEDAALTVLLGERAELARLRVAALPAEAAGASTAFAPTDKGAPTLVISGDSREQWSAAIAELAKPVERPLDVPREVIATEAWRTPDAPMFLDGRRMRFGDLGMRSQQFSGRRFITDFQIGVPADFYADSYGEARILLDAGYSDAVQPGSLINVYVNGNIASSFPITTRNGEILEHFPIKVTMRHLRPGVNTIQIEVNLVTESDAVCAPGTTADTTARFAIFETSEFVMPSFGRIAQRPNLSAMSGTGFPYGRAANPVAIVVNRGDEAELSAAATLFGRLAAAAGRIIPVEFTGSVDAVNAREAIFIGVVNDMPSGALKSVGISEETRSSWVAPDAPGATSTEGQDVTQAEFREQISGSWFTRTWRSFSDWMGETFNISREMLRFAPATEEDFIPSRDVGLVVAQRGNPTHTASWTMITAPDQTMLTAGIDALARQENWAKLAGHLTTFRTEDGTARSLPVTTFDFVGTQNTSLNNYRLIAANWLSANILSYSALLVLCCAALGGTTTLLLSRLGRRR